MAIFAIFITFIDPNNILNHRKNREKISELKEEVNYYNQKYEKDTRLLDELNNNPKAILRIAREKYFMKAADEDVFVFETKPKNK